MSKVIPDRTDPCPDESKLTGEVLFNRYLGRMAARVESMLWVRSAAKDRWEQIRRGCLTRAPDKTLVILSRSAHDRDNKIDFAYRLFEGRALSECSVAPDKLDSFQFLKGYTFQRELDRKINMLKKAQKAAKKETP